MPLIAGESSYEGLDLREWGGGVLSSDAARQMFWVGLMHNGAAGGTYGTNGIWQVNRRGAPYGPKLPPEEQFAELELFRGDMLRHNLVAHLPAQAQEQVVSFNGVDWLSYVPLRLHGIVITRDRLPGKAAMLVNPANNDPELALTVDELELQIFNAIDSRRTAAEIIQLAAGQLGKNPDVIRGKARLLFEQLWWYDLVGGFVSLFKCGMTKGANP